MSVTTTCRDLNELTEQAQKACSLFLKECKNQGLNILVTETYRSQERQNYLYEQGRTRPGKVVTWTKSSRHTSRMAWDVCKNVKGHEYDDAGFFRKCGEIAARLGITWGGNWDSPDTPHFEIDKSWKPPMDTIKINLNGAIKEVEAINKNGHNYVKLQDLRDNYIEIGYDKMPIVKVKRGEL